MLSCSVMSNFVTPWTAAHQAPLSMGILQARILEWVAMPSFKESSQPRDWTVVSCISHTSRWILYYCATWEVQQTTDCEPNLPAVCFCITWEIRIFSIEERLQFIWWQDTLILIPISAITGKRIPFILLEDLYYKKLYLVNIMIFLFFCCSTQLTGY